MIKITLSSIVYMLKLFKLFLSLLLWNLFFSLFLDLLFEGKWFLLFLFIYVFLSLPFTFLPKSTLWRWTNLSFFISIIHFLLFDGKWLDLLFSFSLFEKWANLSTFLDLLFLFHSLMENQLELLFSFLPFEGKQLY